jgi:hypothetical protein
LLSVWGFTFLFSFSFFLSRCNHRYPYLQLASSSCTWKSKYKREIRVPHLACIHSPFNHPPLHTVEDHRIDFQIQPRCHHTNPSRSKRPALSHRNTKIPSPDHYFRVNKANDIALQLSPAPASTTCPRQRAPCDVDVPNQDRVTDARCSKEASAVSHCVPVGAKTNRCRYFFCLGWLLSRLLEN